MSRGKGNPSIVVYEDEDYKIQIDPYCWVITDKQRNKNSYYADILHLFKELLNLKIKDIAMKKGLKKAIMEINTAITESKRIFETLTQVDETKLRRKATNGKKQNRKVQQRKR